MTIADLHIDGWTREQDELPKLPHWGWVDVLAWHPLDSGPQRMRYTGRGWEDGRPWPSARTVTHWREIR